MIGKGKLGVTYKFYAILAFVLAFFDETTLFVGIILGFVLLVEQDEWTSRQCMQALFLTLFSSVVSAVVGVLMLIPFLGWILSFFVGIFDLVVWIFAIIALVNVVKGKEANLPVLSKWAYKAFGYLPQPVAPVAPPPPAPGQPYYGQPQPPMGQPMMGQPPMAPQGQPPMGQPPMAPMAPMEAPQPPQDAPMASPEVPQAQPPQDAPPAPPAPPVV